LRGQAIAPTPFLGREGPEGLSNAAPDLPIEVLLAVVTGLDQAIAQASRAGGMLAEFESIEPHPGLAANRSRPG
jgi:hypothetical protein